MTENTEKIAHLEMIQGVINRFGTNSFLIKGWSVALASGLFALVGTDTNIDFVYIAPFPVLIFWFLDACYLRHEHLFRKLYESVRIKSNDKIDFCMDTKPFLNEIPSSLYLSFSKTIGLFHSVILATVIIAGIILTFKGA